MDLTKFKKFSKVKASYIEYDGHFCYNRVYWINADGGKCMLVEDDRPDVMGEVSDEGKY